MMRLLIINQHTSNHGDEAAGMALYDRLLGEPSVEEIGILYNSYLTYESEKMPIKNAAKEVLHFAHRKLKFMDKVILAISLFTGFWIFGKLCKESPLGAEYRLMKRYDKIISAPGGVNIGPYRDWRYLWRLHVALEIGKPIAIFAISFGPLPKSLIFKIVAMYTLARVDFFSVRETGSYDLSKRLDLKCLLGIDTAFLRSKSAHVCSLSRGIVLDEEFVVFVPNELFQWHRLYLKREGRFFDQLYVDIVNSILDTGLKVIMLPQLFGIVNDSMYCERLRLRSSNSSRIQILDESMSSEYQQAVISRASFVVGARYHSIVFAINQGVPFFSLSYEHKMSDLLRLLGLGEYYFDMGKVKDENSVEAGLKEFLKVYNMRHVLKRKIEGVRKVAADIAILHYKEFSKIFLSR